MYIGGFILGVVITIGGIAFLRYHRQIANSFGSGPGSYDRYKLTGLIIVIGGLLVMTNIFTLLLEWLVRIIFPALN